MRLIEQSERSLRSFVIAVATSYMLVWLVVMAVTAAAITLIPPQTVDDRMIPYNQQQKHSDVLDQEGK